MITQAVFQDHILDQILAFNEYGITSSYSKNGVDYFVNQFWTSKQRQGNSLHEISYRACFKSELPKFFITRLSGFGDIVHDPFITVSFDKDFLSNTCQISLVKGFPATLLNEMFEYHSGP